MEARVEKHLRALIEGRVEEEIPKTTDIIGYDPGFRPIVKKNVGYIVSAVILSAHDTAEVLLIQECKGDAKGLWYLPAGKVNPNENMLDAVNRLVKAETGYGFKPTALVTVEACTGAWYRFTFAGKTAGGQMKTKDMRDDASIQARWFPMPTIRDQRIIRLRSEDILPVIDEALRYDQAKAKHPPSLPLERPYPTMTYRLVTVHHREGDTRVRALVNKKKDGSFPIGAIKPSDNWIHQAKYRILEEIFGREDIRTDTCGVLSVEHYGKPQHENDGLCITCLVSTEEEKALHKEAYEWVEIMDGTLTYRIKERLDSGMSIPLMDIH